MPSSPYRIIVDTNLWISFLITKNYAKLGELILNKSVLLIFSDELFSEFVTVIQRPKFQRYFSEKDVNAIIDMIDTYAQFVEVKTEVDVCRDVKDNFLLALSVDAQADFLITGDSDLLDLKMLKTTRILNITDFLTEITPNS